MSRKLFIRTYGCQMNAYDSARMADVLAALGFHSVETPEGADMVIVNTCHIREKASEKTFSELGRLNRLKTARAAAGGRMILAVAGCVAQAEGEEILRRAPYVDIVLGPQTYHRLPEMLARAQRAAERGAGGAGILDTEFPPEPKFDRLPEPSRSPGPSAFLTVQEGCDKFCSFCVVPYTRGAEFSRPAAQVLAEARLLVAAGVAEITLLGQNVNAYHGEAADGSNWGLARLVLALAEIDGLARIRYTTSHPADMTQALIDAHRDCDKLMPYLHLPAQAGADRVLAAMNRRYGAEGYLELVARLRQARPDIALSGDFIVGFPGERAVDFEATLELIRRVGYAQAYSFKYSARPGTPAALLDGQVPEAEKAARLARLQALLEAQQRRFNEARIGARMPVLLERPGRYPGQLVGRSPYMQAVHVEGDDAHLGEIATVEITAATGNSLAGRRLPDTARAA
ncbi:MAG: tRNA (N6-isopentenyl adenosine(37)-C2)-methylthiotransferase MiaB [Alphaproteobacteria bacterium]|nr:tRNA (N6-isopentenyl adenosine(37)-C2)-methylthiotransferase MiaB [Alphaproteobacteria bacterium]